MASIIAVCGYLACQAGEFTCTVEKFPDISHVMGVAPRNKLYAIMLTIYSCTKQVEARAYHDRLSSFVSPTVNSFLLLASLATIVGGPGIGFWDCYYDMDLHMWATTTFVIGEVVYGYTLTYILATNRDQFPQEAGVYIDRNKTLCFMVAIVGLLMQFGNTELGISIMQIGEWIAFYSDFIMRYNVANIIKYKAVVVPSKSQ